MRAIPYPIILVAAAICLLIAAGCISAPPAAKAPTAGPSVQQYPSVSYDTPVRYANANGARLAYHDFGSGEPLLMITGFGNVMTGWNQTFIGILASKYHVFIYDPRGMGNSSEYNATPTIQLFADDAAGLMDARGYSSMHVYGVSMGSSTAQQLAISHPEHVRKLILDSSTYSVRIPETKLLLRMIEVIAIDPAKPDGNRKEAAANLLWNGSYDGLSGINKDVMIVVGTEDPLTPQEVSVRIASQINGSWLVRFKGLTHFGSRYAPVEYGENALYFLGTNEAPKASL